MKLFCNKKILALAISGALIFGGELPCASAFNSGVNVNVNVQQQGGINWNKGADSDVIAVGISRPDPRRLGTFTRGGNYGGAKKFNRCCARYAD